MGESCIFQKDSLFSLDSLLRISSENASILKKEHCFAFRTWTRSTGNLIWLFRSFYDVRPLLSPHSDYYDSLSQIIPDLWLLLLITYNSWTFLQKLLD